MYYPIQDDDRATGFLLPTYGRSTYRGHQSATRSSGQSAATRTPRSCTTGSHRGARAAAASTRYIVSPQSQGDFRAYALKEHASDTGDPSAPERTSYQLSGNVTQAMPAGLRGRARVDYFSDITAQQLYNNNLYQQTYSTRSIGGGVSGAWSGLSVSGTYQRNESFYNTNDSFGQRPGAGRDRVVHRPAHRQAAALCLGQLRCQPRAVSAEVV